MFRRTFLPSLLLPGALVLLSCSPLGPAGTPKPTGQAPPTPLPSPTGAPAAPTAIPSPVITTQAPQPPLLPSDLTYLGAFRLPDLPGPDEYTWKWANWSSALAYDPGGDPTGPDDGSPGSLFGTGHDWNQWVSEVTIPAPVLSSAKDLADLPTAATLQPFYDLRGGLFGEMEMPRVGLAYLPPQGDQTTGKLYFAWAPHLDQGATHPSHGWAELPGKAPGQGDLANPQPAGPWRVGDYQNYLTGDYLFDIPADWAAAHTDGRSLATGRFRDGGQGAQGPSLLAIAPWLAGDPPPAGTTLPATPLLLYGDVTTPGSPQMDGYHHSDEWTGAAWLSAADRAAILFVGTKGTGDCWYGCADGTIWEPPYPPACPDDSERGWWSTGFSGQFLFYDPADLAEVAAGRMEPGEPQPYATLDVDPLLYHITGPQQKYHLGAAAFDRERALLYVLEVLADDDKPIVHTWRVDG